MKKVTCIIISCLFIFAGFAQTKIEYVRREVMIPMHDGAKLYTVIYTPANTKETVPILMQRTPYGSEDMQNPLTNSYVKDMAEEGYIFVTQDIRGRYKSEGQFVMNRPVTDKPGDVDESTDTYDAIDWLVHNLSNNNGKVGQLGISYPGWLTLAAAARPHPAMKAASEQACMGQGRGRRRREELAAFAERRGGHSTPGRDQPSGQRALCGGIGDRGRQPFAGRVDGSGFANR